MNLKLYRLYRLFLILTVYVYSTLVGFAQTVLYDFNSNLQGFQLFGATGSPALFYSSNGGNGGTGAMQYSLDQSAPFGGVFNNTNVPVTDWSSFETISFYVRANIAVAGNTVSIEMEESSGEKWKQEMAFEATTDFQRVEVRLYASFGPATDGFQRSLIPPGGGNNILDLNNITEVTFVVNPSGTTPPSRVTYFIDAIELNVSVQPTLSLSANVVDFNGPIQAIISNHRFSSDTIEVSYATPVGSTWEIRIYTTRLDSVEGLVANDGSGLTIPLKFDIDADDDPEDDNAFGFPGSPEEALRFFSVLDDGTVDGQGNPLFSILASSENGDPPSDNAKEMRFAIDAAGAKANVTYSATVTLDLHMN